MLTGWRVGGAERTRRRVFALAKMNGYSRIRMVSVVSSTRRDDAARGGSARGYSALGAGEGGGDGGGDQRPDGTRAIERSREVGLLQGFDSDGGLACVKAISNRVNGLSKFCGVFKCEKRYFLWTYSVLTPSINQEEADVALNSRVETHRNAGSRNVAPRFYSRPRSLVGSLRHLTGSKQSRNLDDE